MLLGHRVSLSVVHAAGAPARDGTAIPAAAALESPSVLAWIDAITAGLFSAKLTGARPPAISRK
jgi:hypothetical protein